MLNNDFPIPDKINITEVISSMMGAEVASLAVVCSVGDGESASVAAFIAGWTAHREVFRHAIEMEGSYSDTLLSFDSNPPPYYESSAADIDLGLAASKLGVDRVLCLITLDGKGSVSALRDYDGLEVTLLEAAHMQLSRFMEFMDGENTVPARRLQ